MKIKDTLLLRSMSNEVITPVEVVFGNILAVNENYYVRKNGNNLELSTDYGISYDKTIDVSVIGDLRMIHVFTNGKLLVCGRKKAYYSDWVTLNESVVKDIDGNNWIAGLNNDNFMSLHGLEVQKVMGNEVAVWGNYNNDENHNTQEDAIAECFCTKDFGQNINVFFKSGVSTAINWVGAVKCRHIHHIQQNPNDQSFWIQTGDEPTANMSHWVRAVYNLTKNTWSFTHIGSGDLFKTTYLKFFGNYIYYARDDARGGLCRVKITDAGDISKHEVVYEVGTDLGGFIMGKNGDVALIATKYFNANYVGCWIKYSSDLIHFHTIIGDMPIGTTNNSIYGRLFQPNSKGDALASVQLSYNQPMYQYTFLPSVFINKIIRKAGFPNAFKDL